MNVAVRRTWQQYRLFAIAKGQPATRAKRTSLKQSLLMDQETINFSFHGKELFGTIVHAKSSWPSGDCIFYKCLACNDVIESNKSGQCTCGNVYVDAECGRAGATRRSQMLIIAAGDSSTNATDQE
ncbi:MAG: hypothetical protein IBJ18_12230 [Phycisphaerales bacterium]|nr:hypothetical protein [Phycisphaerales bacterium]